MTASFITLAYALNLPEQHETEQKLITTALKRWLQKQAHWLLILDNVEDFELIYDFIPLQHAGHVLMTTRAVATGTFAYVMSVPKMDWQEGTLLLLKRSKMLTPEALLSDTTEANTTAGRDISQILDGLPLALDQAGAYIDETHASLVDYLARYHQQSAKLLQRRGKLAFDHPQSVMVTFTLAFERLQQTHTVSANLLRFLAFLHPDSIPEELLSQDTNVFGPELQSIASDPFEIDAAIEELLKYSLVRRSSDTKMVSLHRLVQTVLKSTMSEVERHQSAEHAVRAVSLLFPSDKNLIWNSAERYLSNAQVCIDLIEQWNIGSPEAARLLQHAGQYFCGRGLYKESSKCLQSALGIGEQVFGSEHPDTAMILIDLAAPYRDQGQYTQAETLLLRALAIQERLLTLDHLDLVTTLSALGFLYLLWGNFDAAEQYLQRTLILREQVLGPDHLDTAEVMNNLAGLYLSQGKYAEAGPLWQRVLAIRTEQLGSEHPYTATSLNNLAGYYYTREEYEQAEPLLLRSLAIREHVLGPEHPRTAHTLSRLAQLYSVQQKYEQAEPVRSVRVKPWQHGGYATG